MRGEVKSSSSSNRKGSGISHLVVVAKNGLGNRFQAISGGIALASYLDRELEVIWEPFDGSATVPSDIFQSSTRIRFIGRGDLLARGIELDELPLYLSVSETVVGLRGYDRGPQVFIRAFAQELKRNPQAEGIVVAGSHFHPDAGSAGQLAKISRPFRKELWSRIKFIPEIEKIALSCRPTSPYIGLHLRGTDRRKEAASPKRLIRQTARIAKRQSVSEVFICSDDERLRDSAVSELVSEGLKVSFDPFVPIRRNIEGELHACADFVNLSKADWLVGPQQSTFFTEAAVRLPRSRVRELVGRTTGSRTIDRILRNRLPAVFP